MKYPCLLALLIAAMPCVPASAETEYRRASLFHGGYRERVLGEGLWRVTVGTDGETAMGEAVRMALYRSAELARAEGYPFIQILWHRGGMRYQQQGRRQMRVLGHSAELKVRGARDAKDPIECEMPQSRCTVHSVEQVLAQIGPTLVRR